MIQKSEGLTMNRKKHNQRAGQRLRIARRIKEVRKLQGGQNKADILQSLTTLARNYGKLA